MVLSVIFDNIIIPRFGALGQQGTHNYLRQLSLGVYVVYYYHFDLALLVSIYFGHVKEHVSSHFFFEGIIEHLFVLSALRSVDAAGESVVYLIMCKLKDFLIEFTGRVS